MTIDRSKQCVQEHRMKELKELMLNKMFKAAFDELLVSIHR